MRTSLANRPLRRGLAFAALTPLISLGLSRTLAAAVGWMGLQQRLPVGLHSYLPAVDLVDVRTLTLAGFALGLLGVAMLVSLGRGAKASGGSLQPATLWRAVLAIVGAQVAIYLIQLAMVSEFRGVPDTFAAIMTALTIQALLAAGSSLSLGALPYAFQVQPLGHVHLTPSSYGILLSSPISHPSGISFGIQPPRRGPPPLSAQFV